MLDVQVRKIGPVAEDIGEVKGDGGEVYGPVPRPSLIDAVSYMRPYDMQETTFHIAAVDGTINAVWGVWVDVQMGVQWERTPEGWYLRAAPEYDPNVIAYFESTDFPKLGHAFPDELEEMRMWEAIRLHTSPRHIDDHIYAIRQRKSRYAGGLAHPHYAINADTVCGLCKDTELLARLNSVYGKPILLHRGRKWQ